MADQLFVFFIDNSSIIWMIVGLALIVIELTLLPGIGFLFAGLAALSLAAILAFDLLLATRVEWQFILFCGMTIVWAVLLWKPFKHYIHRNKSYDMYIGTTAVVQGQPLIRGVTGTVRWSGTNMRSKIRHGSQTQTIDAGKEVYVHAVENGLILVDIDTPTNA